MKKKRIAIVCPGRGTYTKETLNYLSKNTQPEFKVILNQLEELRRNDGLLSIKELDLASAFSTPLHTRGENAASLIYACSYLDFLNFKNNDNYEIVAVTGNSMGWYLALSFSQVLDSVNSYKVIQGMGQLMQQKAEGGQIIYPIIDSNWNIDKSVVTALEELIDSANSQEGIKIEPSIFLGGYLIWGANKKGLDFLNKNLPKKDHFPFQLINHGAFHTSLMDPISKIALDKYHVNNFNTPLYPLIDGRGKIWQPYSTDLNELFNYTFDHQIRKPYDFTTAIEVTIKEFNPDHLVLLGPGNTLGGPVGQILVKNQWNRIKNKESFISFQSHINPFVISAGL